MFPNSNSISHSELTSPKGLNKIQKPDSKAKVPPINMARESPYLKVPVTNGKQDWEDMLDNQSDYKSEKS